MRTIFAVFVFFSSMVISLSAEEIIPCNPTYVTPNQLHFTDSSIFVQIDDVWIQPAALYVDANGFYFNAIRHDEKDTKFWRCQRKSCQALNYDWAEYCRKCGARRGSSN